jgi:hypothetical protein
VNRSLGDATGLCDRDGKTGVSGQNHVTSPLCIKVAASVFTEFPLLSAYAVGCGPENMQPVNVTFPAVGEYASLDVSTNRHWLIVTPGSSPTHMMADDALL